MVKAQKGTVIKIDDLQELGVLIDEGLSLGIGLDGITINYEDKEPVSAKWDRFISILLISCAERYKRSTEKQRIEFLTSIGAVYTGMTTSGPSFLMYPREKIDEKA